MTWTKIKGFVAVMGCLVALGGRSGSASGFLPVRRTSRPNRSRYRSPRPRPRSRKGRAPPSSSLVKKYDDAVKATQDTIARATTDAERMKVYKTLGPFPDDYIPPVVALAEKYPGDPAAADALFWVADRSLSFARGPDRPAGR